MCMFCKEENVKMSITTHVVNCNGCLIIVKNVPCQECEQCGEKYYSDEVAEKLERIINIAKELMQELSILDYSKTA